MARPFHLALSPEDLRDARMLFGIDGMLRRRVLAAFVLMAPASTLIFVLLGAPWGQAWLIGALTTTLGWVLVIVLTFARLFWGARRALAASPLLHRRQEIDWNDVGLTCRDDEGSVVHYRWTDIRRAARNRKAIVLYLAPGIFAPIPLRCLTDREARDLWDDLARNGRPGIVMKTYS